MSEIRSLTVWCSSCLPGKPCFACETPNPPPLDIHAPPAPTTDPRAEEARKALTESKES